MAGKIFINYRRDDSAGTAGRLHDRLAQTFGRNNLFMDVDHIPAGVDFTEYLHNQVAACDVFLAVIGPDWLDAKDINRGVAYSRKGDHDRAISDYNEGIGLDPKNADAFYNRGWAYSRKSDYDRAIADFNEAIRLDPKYALPYTTRAGLSFFSTGAGLTSSKATTTEPSRTTTRPFDLILKTLSHFAIGGVQS